METKIEVTENLKVKLSENVDELIELLGQLTILAPPSGTMCAPTYLNGLGIRAKRLLHLLDQPIPKHLGTLQFGTGVTNAFLEELKKASAGEPT